MTNLQRLLAALTAIVCITLAMSSCKPKSEPTKPTTTTEILQIKDFPYLKRDCCTYYLSDLLHISLIISIFVLYLKAF